MRTMALVLAAAFALSIPTAAVVKAEDTTVIKKDRDFDRDKVIIKKKEPRHLYMYDRDRDDVRRHRPGVSVVESPAGEGPGFLNLHLELIRAGPPKDPRQQCPLCPHQPNIEQRLREVRFVPKALFATNGPKEHLSIARRVATGRNGEDGRG